MEYIFKKVAAYGQFVLVLYTYLSKYWLNQVEDLFTDLGDGRKLLKLLEIISGEKLGKPNSGKMRVHRVENVNKSLAFLHTKVKFFSQPRSFILVLLRRTFFCLLVGDFGNIFFISRRTFFSLWESVLLVLVQDPKRNLEENTDQNSVFFWMKCCFYL